MTSWIVTSSLLIVIVVALRYLLRGKISLRLQYALWVIVLLRLLVPVQLGHTGFSVLNTVEENQELQITVSRPLFYLGETPDLAIPEIDPTLNLSEEALQHLRQQSEQQYYEEMAQYATPVSPSTVLYALWITGIVVTSGWFLAANLRFARALRRSRRETSLACGKLAVYVSPLVDTPCLFGLFHPAVYVTEDVLQSETALHHTLLHEETHYRHGDHIWSALRGLCLALHWYNPLVWLAAVLSRRDVELACDEGTLRRLGEAERTAYGETLIRLTCGRKKGELLLTATTMTGGKSGLRERIKLIAKRPKMAAYALIAAVLVVIVAAGCTFTGSKEPAEPEFSFLELPDTPVDAQVLSAVKTYIIAHADILNDLAEPGAVTGAYIHSIDPSPTGETENGLGLYEVVYYLQCNDPRSFVRLQELCESTEFAEKWQAEGTNGNAPVLTNPIHSGFQAQVLAPYIPVSQAPVSDGPSTAFLVHLSKAEQLDAALSRLASLQPADLDLDESNYRAAKLGADTLISLVHRAVEQRIERTGETLYSSWDVWVSLGKKPQNSSLRQERLSFTATAEENVLKITYQSLDNVSVTFYADDSEAYWTIRNTYRTTDGPVDEAALAPFLPLVEAEAQEWIDLSVSWPQPLNGYEIVTFQPRDRFRHEGADYAVYFFDVAFPVDAPLTVGLAGGAWLDNQCRIRSLLKVDHVLVRTVNGKTSAMLGAFDIVWSDRQTVIDAFTRLDLADAPVSYTDTHSDSPPVIFAAKKYILQQIEAISRLTGDSDFVASGEIRSIKAIPTGTSAENSGINLYHMDYRLHLQNSDTLYTDLGNFSYVEENGVLYLKETGSLGTPVLAMEYHPQENDERIWTFLGTFHTGDIEVQYGGDYVAAAMDIYQSAGYTIN